MAAAAPSPIPGADPYRDIRDKITQARAHRKPREATWASNLAFAAGKHDLVWDRTDRKLVLPPELEGKTDLYVADVITEQRAAALGELQADDDRPELLLVQEGEDAEEIQEQVNQAIGFGWDHEWRGDDALLQMRRIILDLGVSPVRCRFDPTVGPVMQKDVPHGADGKPILELEKARSYVADQQAAGQSAGLRSIREGCIRWQVGSPYNILVPPGIPHERDFPWEVWVQPTLLDSVKQQYPKAAELIEDTDIASVLGLGAREEDPTGRGTGDDRAADANRLRGHIWLFTYYERPTVKHPDGRVIVLGGNRMLVLEETNELPYLAPDGTRRSGIHYFHWWRLNDRFWSRAFIENLKDPQRMINRRKRQIGEIIDRGMPKVFVEEGTLPHNPKGLPLEVIEMKKDAAKPDFHVGIGPGDWMYRDLAELREDLSHASTLSALRLGENPANVQTYSQLALLNENEQQKRAPILKEHKDTIGRLVEDSVYDIRTYWPEEKQLILAGDDKVQAVRFRKSVIPDFFVVKVAKGNAKPRSQGAELQKVQDIARYSIDARTPLPVGWYAESLDAGEVVDLPEGLSNDQADVAELENHVLLNGGQAPVAYFDLPGVHIPVHRIGQNMARMADNPEALQAIEAHIQEHLAVAAQNAAEAEAQAQAMQQMMPPPGAPPPAPGGGAPPEDLDGTAGLPVAPQGPPPVMPPIQAPLPA